MGESSRCQQVYKEKVSLSHRNCRPHVLSAFLGREAYGMEARRMWNPGKMFFKEAEMISVILSFRPELTQRKGLNI